MPSPPPDLPVDVLAFIAEHLTSVQQLEALLLLRGSERSWAAEQIERELGTSRESVARALDELRRTGLAGVDGGQWRYAPRDAATRKAADDLARVYRTRRVSVITAIFASPDDRLRTFSDAFRIRRNDG